MRTQPSTGRSLASVTKNKLALAVAKSHRLTPDEAAQLHGKSLSQLVSQARALVDRRDGEPLDVETNPKAGKEFAAQAVSDMIRFGDATNQQRLLRLATGTPRPRVVPTRSAAAQERIDRINERLAAAGVIPQDDYPIGA